MTKKNIDDSDFLLRGVSPEQWNFDKDRPSTGVLRTDELSTDAESMRSVEDFMARHDRKKNGHGLVKFAAKVPRDHALNVEHDPCPIDDIENEAHVLVLGKKKKPFTKLCEKPGSDLKIVHKCLRPPSE